jgi:hypothetical protein
MEERHIGMTLQRIDSKRIEYKHTYEVLDKDQFLTREFD